MALEFCLRANNSGENLRLHFYKDNDEFYPCITGEIGGEPIQMDFDALSHEDVEDLIYLLRRIAPEPKQLTLDSAN